MAFVCSDADPDLDLALVLDFDLDLVMAAWLIGCVEGLKEESCECFELAQPPVEENITCTI